MNEQPLIQFDFPVFPESIQAVDRIVTNVNERGMSTVVIMRGMPGSGKSTMAAEIAFLLQRVYGRHTMVCSADEQMYNAAGEYTWSAESVRLAHDRCFMEYCSVLLTNAFAIIVDNTNIRVDEYQRYEDGALARGYCVLFVAFDCDGVEAAVELCQRTTHDIPRIQLQRRYEQYKVALKMKDKDVIAVNNQADNQARMHQVRQYFIW
jgi:predicted ABC-type ATPase